MDPSLDPSKFEFRESVDSPANPLSTPLILACDVTGSMGHLAEDIVKRGLGMIMKEVYERKPITDPHIMCCAVGDTNSDEAPLQATQFEASVEPLTAQVEKIWLEGRGGGNRGESYLATWFLAGYKVKADAISKRGRKGYLFTIGDEPPLHKLSREHVRRHFGLDLEVDLTARGLLDMIEPDWEVFHLRVNEYPGAEAAWRELLGERAITVKDWHKLPEIIVSTMQVVEGESVSDVAGSWDGSTAVVVGDAIKNLTTRRGGSGVVTL